MVGSRVATAKKQRIQIMEEFGGSVPEYLWREFSWVKESDLYTAGAIASIVLGYLNTAVTVIWCVISRLFEGDLDIGNPAIVKRSKKLPEIFNWPLTGQGL